MHQEHMSCIEQCNACAAECEHCATACIAEPDAGARQHCIKLLRDCADICALSARFMARGSQHAKHVCAECAEICEECATECARFQDEHCKRCAEMCRQCAAECRRIIA